MIGFLWNLAYTGFWDRWLRIRYQTFKIQNGAFKLVAVEMKNRDNIGKNVYLGIFGVADYDSVIRFSKFKMAYWRLWPSKWKTAIILVKMYIRRFFGVADYESVIRFSKFKMAAAEKKNCDNIRWNYTFGWFSSVSNFNINIVPEKPIRPYEKKILKRIRSSTFFANFQYTLSRKKY